MHFLKHLWIRGLRRARDEYEEAQSDVVHASPLIRLALYAFFVYFFCAILLGIYWSFAPAPVNVKDAIQSQTMLTLGDHHAQLPSGVATTSTLIVVSETLLNKSGGYISNDICPPGIWLDNISHWEFGVLQQVRATAQALRGSFSQSTVLQHVDMDLQKAEVRFNFSSSSWVFPATESQYLSGVEHLQKYNMRLMQGEIADAHFYADAEHLSDYLAGVEQRLRSLSQRLTASIGPRINTDTAALSVTSSEQLKAESKITNGLYTKTPWLQLDDVFYEARGSAWAMLALLQGVEMDFSDVLKNKNAQASFEQIIRELQATQQPVYSPMILNGEGFGFVANHSLAMASYLSRAQAAIADCRRQLLLPSQ